MRPSPPATCRPRFLYTETDDADLTYFFVYHLGILHRSVDALNAYLERKVAETRQMREVLAAKSSAYNGRQIALIQNAVKNPDATYSVQSHMISHRIAMETARKDLVELETAGLLRKARVGKRFVFEAVPDIMRELHGAEVRRPRRTGQR